VESAVEVDAHDKRVSYILLDSPQQGHEYEIRITGGAGASGAPLTDTYELTVATPLPLEISELSPRGGAYGVKPDRPISIKFAEPIQDRAAAEAAITIEPAIAGRFEWPEPDRVQFVPQHTLPYLTRINVTIQPGPAGARGDSGGYLEEEVDYSFLTQPNKLIVVDLTRQRLTLYEGDKAVYTTLVATGVRFAETPTGDFIIHLKWPALRMRGVNPSGTRYDIPNVPWVMQFLGDYTFHSAPWRSQFGFPQSNGCVSMETGAAKYVYDWTPIGTPVRIHY
jgi:lipoprotein-anchoring transpeptidase ErfK/SrfK